MKILGKILCSDPCVCEGGGRIGQQATVRIAVRCAGGMLGGERRDPRDGGVRGGNVVV